MKTLGSLLLAAALASAVLIPVPAHSTATADPAPPPARPKVHWRPCPTDQFPTKQCGTLRVPRDYRHRARGSFRIGLARIPATGTAGQRIGSLVWDAGGPGGVSTESLSFGYRQSAAINRRFDFVAFDPRGIGTSTPALEDCGQPWPVRPGRNPHPNWRGVQRRSASVLRADNRSCARRNGAFVQTMGTSNVVRDTERLRRALGDEQLTFWATSYGTRIGYVYALRYPDRVRAMVLDGNIDPTGDFAGLAEIGGRSQDGAFRFLTRHDPALARTVRRTAVQLTADPLRLGGGARFTRWNWLDIVGDTLPFPDMWSVLPPLARKIRIARGTGPEAQAIRAGLAASNQRPNSNEGKGFSVVNCLDYADRLTARRQARIAGSNARGGPFGGSLSTMYAIGCAGLGSLDPDPIPTLTTPDRLARVADVPVVIANATHDGSTPMAWGKRMWRAFGKPPFIKYRSTQHVIWGGAKSRCVNRPIDRFVIGLRRPASRTCPFVPPAAAP